MMTNCPALPKGWRREEVVRRSGLSGGKIDVFYYSPQGQKFRTKPQLARYLGDHVDLSSFDYRTGKINAHLLRKSSKSRKYEGRNSRYNEAALVPPIRQTGSIFKQPVTVMKTQPTSVVKADLKTGANSEKPKQVFWEKRLEKLRSTNVDQECYDKIDLPKFIKPVGPHITEDSVIRSICAGFHLLPNQPITGQSAEKSNLEKYPGAFINPDQPLMASLIVSDEEIRRQEERVSEVRRKLERLINGY